MPCKNFLKISFVSALPLPVGALPAAVSVTDACREEVYQFKIQRNTNINLNVPLGQFPAGFFLL